MVRMMMSKNSIERIHELAVMNDQLLPCCSEHRGMVRARGLRQKKDLLVPIESNSLEIPSVLGSAWDEVWHPTLGIPATRPVTEVTRLVAIASLEVIVHWRTADRSFELFCCHLIDHRYLLR
jgi:hypothetical protein